MSISQLGLFSGSYFDPEILTFAEITALEELANIRSVEPEGDDLSFSSDQSIELGTPVEGLFKAVFYADKLWISEILDSYFTNADSWKDLQVVLESVCANPNAIDLLTPFYERGILDALTPEDKVELLEACMENDNTLAFFFLLGLSPEVNLDSLYTSMVKYDAHKVLGQFIPSVHFANVSHETLLESLSTISYFQDTETFKQLLASSRKEEIEQSEKALGEMLDNAIFLENFGLTTLLLKHDYEPGTWTQVLRTAIDNPQNILALSMLLDCPGAQKADKAELLYFIDSLELENEEAVKDLINEKLSSS